MNVKPIPFFGLPHFEDDDVYVVNRITAGAVGEMGSRVYILQAHLGPEPVSWVIGKEQALALSRAIPRLLADVRAEFPELADPLLPDAPNLALSEPLRPEFHVGSLEVGYDRFHDLVVLTLMDAAAFEPREEDLDHPEDPLYYVYTTRGQALLLGRRAEEVVTAGRPLCPRCGDPIDDFGHFCPPATASSRGVAHLH